MARVREPGMMELVLRMGQDTAPLKTTNKASKTTAVMAMFLVLTAVCLAVASPILGILKKEK
jgi:hypothetical protein